MKRIFFLLIISVMLLASISACTDHSVDEQEKPEITDVEYIYEPSYISVNTSFGRFWKDKSIDGNVLEAGYVDEIQNKSDSSIPYSIKAEPGEKLFMVKFLFKNTGKTNVSTNEFIPLQRDDIEFKDFFLLGDEEYKATWVNMEEQALSEHFDIEIQKEVEVVRYARIPIDSVDKPLTYYFVMGPQQYIMNLVE